MSRESKTFCVQPWLHQMVTSGGDAGFCCVAAPPDVRDERGRPVSLREGGFEAAWNGPGLRAIRRAMLEGRPVSGCETCYFQEKSGKTSHRRHHNLEWTERLGTDEIDRRIDESVRGGFALPSSPVYLHLCLGNLCNLKCRMCNPYNSLMIHEEWKRLDAKGGEYSRFWAKHGCGDADVPPWHEYAGFWDGVEKMIPSLRKVYMTGGEPTLIEGNYRFMRRCIELRRAGEIELLFNVNGTRIPEEFLGLVNEFAAATVNVSLDGIGAVGEYIRSPSRWSAVSKNLEALIAKAGPRVSVGVTPVVQAYNALDLVPLLEYVDGLERSSGRSIRVDLLDCRHPAFLAIDILPRAVKDEAIRRLEAFRDGPRGPGRKPGPHARVLENGLASLLAQLRDKAPGNAPELLKAFSYYTSTLDAHRGESFAKACPDLHERLIAEGAI